MDETLYRPLPQDWLIGTADVVASTRLSATTATRPSTWRAPRDRFNCQCAGPGISLRVRWRRCELCGVPAMGRTLRALRWPRPCAGRARNCRSNCVAPWCRSRACEKTASTCGSRASRHRRTSRYAMFTGGGLAWAEAAMKQGRFAVPSAEAGTRPDLTGPLLPLRGNAVGAWAHPGAAGGCRQSALARRISGASSMIWCCSSRKRGTLRCPAGAPAFGWPPAGVELEVHISVAARASPIAVRRAGVLFRPCSIS